jgi:hypothetical protein
MDHRDANEGPASIATSRTPLLDSDRRSDTSSTLTASETLPVKDGSTAIDDSVLPEDSALGRKIGWSSAYILV